jgi:signal transduction protein with GAF and PtsI domain
MAKLKIIIDNITGSVIVRDSRPEPTTQEEWQERASQENELVEQMHRDNNFEMEIEVE